MQAEPWTAEQIQCLVDNYHLCEIKDIAAKLGRTVGRQIKCNYVTDATNN